MTIKTISYSMTRQITNFHPASYSITADLAEGEDIEKATKALQLLVIKVLYKDIPKTRDELITQLCGPENQEEESPGVFG